MQKKVEPRAWMSTKWKVGIVCARHLVIIGSNTAVTASSRRNSHRLTAPAHLAVVLATNPETTVTGWVEAAAMLTPMSGLAQDE